jgi:hypothetical protein
MSNVPGAGPVRNEHAFDVGSLERFLAAKVESFGAGTTIAELLQFKGGQSNPTFYIKDSRGNEFVLRKKPPGKLLPSAVRYNLISQPRFNFAEMDHSFLHLLHSLLSTPMVDPALKN